MLPRNLLGTAVIPDTDVQLQLYQSGAVAGNPLDDQRSHVFVGDVADLIRQEQASFDAILLPECLVQTRCSVHPT